MSIILAVYKKPEFCGFGSRGVVRSINKLISLGDNSGEIIRADGTVGLLFLIFLKILSKITAIIK